MAKIPGVYSEHDEQCSVIQWADMQLGMWPELKMLAAVPNGGLRTKATAGKLKAEGVKPGYPDLLLDVARGKYHGLRIEMKALKGSVSVEQKRWLADLVREGYCARVCYGFEEARTTLVWYMSGAIDAA